MMTKGAYFYANGKRKSAVATVRLYPQGSGDVTINGKTMREWADTQEMLNRIQRPLSLVKKNEVNLEIIVRGGGKVAQSDSVALGIARAFVKKDPELRETFKAEKLLTRDSRVKERKKPGRKRARKSGQWSKR